MPSSLSVFIVLLEEAEQRQRSLMLEKAEKKILAVKMIRHCQLACFEMLPTMAKLCSDECSAFLKARTPFQYLVLKRNP